MKRIPRQFVLALVGLVAATATHALRTDPPETDVALATEAFGPLRAIGRLEAPKALDGRLVQAHGTAFFIAPCHVATVAHLLFSRDEEARLFRLDPAGARVPRPRGELLAFVRELQQDIEARSPRGRMRFHVLRDRNGDFDRAQALRVERIVGVDFAADVAVLRVDRCLGVPERLGHFALPEADWERADAQLDALRRDSVPLLSAGYPGDQPGDALRLNSSTDYTVLDFYVHHGVSNHRGSSGSPLFAFVPRASALVPRAGASEPRGGATASGPVDRSAFLQAETRKRLAREFVPVLVGVNVSHNPEVSPGNFARRLPAGPIAKVLREDWDLHRPLLERRLREARRVE